MIDFEAYLASPQAIEDVVEDMDAWEAVHRQALERAKAEYEQACLGVAYRRALDALLPGWVYVDALDHLPREKLCQQ